MGYIYLKLYIHIYTHKIVKERQTNREMCKSESQSLRTTVG